MYVPVCLCMCVCLCVCVYVRKPYANLALNQANANFGALAQRPFFK